MAWPSLSRRKHAPHPFTTGQFATTSSSVIENASAKRTSQTVPAHEAERFRLVQLLDQPNTSSLLQNQALIEPAQLSSTTSVIISADNAPLTLLLPTLGLCYFSFESLPLHANQTDSIVTEEKLEQQPPLLEP